MSRNVFDQSGEEPKKVPLTLGVGGPVVGTAKIVDGKVVGEISDETVLKKLQGDLSSFAIGRDPADRYRVNSQPIENVTCNCGKYQGCEICGKYQK